MPLGELKITTTDFGPLPEDEYYHSEYVSADQRHYAVSIKGQVVFDGRYGKTYAYISDPFYRGLVLSPTGGRHAYFAWGEQDESLLVVDGQEFCGFDNFHLPVFSRDGKHWACFADRGDATCLLMDGKEISKFDRAEGDKGLAWRMAFDVEGNLNYTAVRDKKTILVLANKEITLPPGGTVRDIAFSSDGRHLLYQVFDGANSFYVLDGCAGPSRPKNYLNLLGFSPKCKLLSYYAGNLYIVDVGPPRSEKAYDGGMHPVFKPDGSLWAFTTYYGNPIHDHQVILDGRDQEEKGSVQSIFFSPDSNHYGYTVFTGGAKAQAGGTMYVVRDGVRETEFWRIDEPRFSPDGKHLAYVARDGMWGVNVKPILYVDGRNIAPPCKDIVFGTLAWSRDNDHVAFAAVDNDGRERMLIRSCFGKAVQSKEDRNYPLGNVPGKIENVWLDVLLKPTFTSDGRHLVWAVQDEGEPALLIVDGMVVLACDHVWEDTFRITHKGGFHVMVEQNRRVVFVEGN